MAWFVDLDTAMRWRARLAAMDERRRRVLIASLGAGAALVGGALLAFLTPVGGVAVMVAAVGALLVLRDVRWGLFALLAVVCLLPFASLPFKVGFTPTFLDLIFGALYAVWGARLITRRQGDFVLTPLGLPVLVFMALAVFCFLLGLSHARPAMNDLRTFGEIMMGMGVFFVVINNVRDRSLVRQLTAALILAGAAEGALGVFLYLIPQAWAVRFLNPLGRLGYPVGPGALRFINDDPNRPMRAIGTNIDPNILGAMLVIVVAISTTQLFARRPVLRRGVLLVALVAMGVCLFLTYSRGSMVGAVVAVGVVAVLRYRRLLLLMLVVGVLVLFLPQTQAYLAHFVQGVQIADRSTQMRMGEYRDALKLIRRYPWIGVGFVGTPDIDLYLAVASIYLTLLGQMGLVGLVAFLVVMAVFMVYVWHGWRASRGGDWEPFVLGYGTAILGCLVSGVFDHTLFTYPHAVALMWFTLGMGVAAVRVAEFHASFTS